MQSDKVELVEDERLLQDSEFKKNVAIPYFKDIYKDLSAQSAEKSKGVDKNALIGYCQLPGILGERLFDVLDINGTGHLSLRDFVFGCFRIFYSNLEMKMKLCFDM